MKATARLRLLPRGGWLTAYAFIYVGFLYLPVLFLPIFSVNTAATPKFPLSGSPGNGIRGCRIRRN